MARRTTRSSDGTATIMVTGDTNSKRLASLLGPSLMAITITEWLNIDIFVSATGSSFAPLVYLNGTLLFVAGLAIVRSHNRWLLGWPVLVTVVGWFAMLAGFARMAAPMAAQTAGENPVILNTSLVVLFVIGVLLAFNGYSRSER